VQPIDARVAARIVADACAGLHAAHELTDDSGHLLGVVHRDVSPHNILVSLEGTVKVTDFGVAKALGQSHQATVAGQIKGKVAYMSPEQIGGLPFDRTSDVFAMGCVLYETLTGQQAFRGGNDPQVMQAVLSGKYEPPARLVPGLAPDLAAIIARALAQEPRMRFATAERMRVALEEWLAKSGSVVTPTQVGSVVRQRLGPHLDKRKDHVRSAMASAQEQDAAAGIVRPAAGMTPSGAGGAVTATAGGSHSGVVATIGDPLRARGPGQPPGSSPLPPLPSKAPLPAPLPPPLPPPRARAASQTAMSEVRAQQLGAAPSGSRYVIAAVAGVVFALVVGGLGVLAWSMMRSHATEAKVVAPPLTTAAVTTSTAKGAPPSAPPPATAHVASGGSAPAPAASSAPATIDINDLPTAKPAWPSGPAPVFTGRGGAAPGPANKPGGNDLPANPY